MNLLTSDQIFSVNNDLKLTGGVIQFAIQKDSDQTQKHKLYQDCYYEMVFFSDFSVMNIYLTLHTT